MISGHNILTHSRMSTAKTCLRMHQYRYELGIRRDRTSQPLRMGSAVHAGIDLLAQGKTLTEAWIEIRGEYADVPDWADPDDWRTEAEKVCRLVAGYEWRWGEDDCEVIATEQAFNLPIKNPDTNATTPTFTFAGKIDKIVRLADGRLAIREHKTCGVDISVDSDYWRRLRIDQQISGYMMAARALGYCVETVEYDVIRKPSIRPKLIGGGKDKVRETADQYGVRLTDDIAERPDFYFARMEIPRLEVDLREFEAELWQIQQTLRQHQLTGRWFRNTGACLHPYKCDYFDLCCNGYEHTDATPTGFVRVDDLHPELV